MLKYISTGNVLILYCLGRAERGRRAAGRAATSTMATRTAARATRQKANNADIKCRIFFILEKIS